MKTLRRMQHREHQHRTSSRVDSLGRTEKYPGYCRKLSMRWAPSSTDCSQKWEGGPTKGSRGTESNWAVPGMGGE